ncbi:hypothetical protein OUZ56_007657 [Daphnia magna]|uniref:Uncharacterized protein n=1 Tax=Daphnia magna TaxID=35525 RepID=A0ABR0AAM9_9CRUS|nr:hypothetical protein OUZ56_007657 [Daphnia magna]
MRLNARSIAQRGQCALRYSIKSLFCAACVSCVLIRPMIVYALRDRRPIVELFDSSSPKTKN